MELSIVTTLFYSEKYIKDFHKRITDTASRITDNYEVIFVNDGSPDKSLEIVLELLENDSKVKLLDLSRNFGHHKAMMTGLQNAKGNYVFCLDVDLEERPELLEEFWDLITKKDDVDVVYGVQNKRKGRFFERVSGSLFFDVFNFFSDVKIPKNIIMTRIMTKRYVEQFILHKERELVFTGLASLTGYRQIPLIVNKSSKGKTTYNFGKKINLAFSAISAFSSKPLVYIFYLGLFITFFSFLFVISLLMNKVFFNVADGWSSVVGSIWLVGGVIIFSIGVIGIYISKIFTEVKDRPYTIIKEKYGFDEGDSK